MIINKVQNNLNFQAIKLSEKDLCKSTQIFEKLMVSEMPQKEKSVLQTALYKIFRPHIEREAAIRTKTSHGFKYNFDDVFAEMNLKFCEMLNDLKNHYSLDIIIEKLDHFTSSKDSIKPEYMLN